MRRIVLASTAFALSGFAALVYQVGWQRLLALQTGIGVHSVAIIVAAFLAGLGAGSHLGGVLSARVSPRRALLAFVAAEAALGLFGAASPFLFYDVLYRRGGWLYDVPWRATALQFLVLVPPTALMGLSLPFLVRALTAGEAVQARVVAVLYGVNMLGASAGALLTPWWLIRAHGLRATLLAAAAANLAAALLAATAARPNRAGEELPRDAGSHTDTPRVSSEPFGLWLALYGLSGFVALSLEILWFRVVDLSTKATAFTFGTVLSLYLLGNAAGSLAGAALAPRMRRPLSVFLLCQCAIAAYAALAVSCLARLPPETPFYDWYVAFWHGEQAFNLGGALRIEPVLRLYLGLPLALFGPPTVLMGLSFAALQRAVQRDARSSGLRVGLLQAANIAGCVLGSLLTGLVLLEKLGTADTLRGLTWLALLAFAGLGLSRFGWRSPFSSAAVALLLGALSLPTPQALWLRLHGLLGSDALVAEDATGVVVLEPRGPRWVVWVDGKTNSSLPFGGTHTLIGALPVLIHYEPLRVAIVGLTSGDTAWAAGSRPETRHLDVFELVASQLRLLQALAERDPPPKLPRFLKDGRYRVHVADGRNALQRADASYDVIVVDGPRPSGAYSNTVYSVEFYEVCARRLAKDGIVSAWVPSARILETFRSVFPHLLLSEDGQVALGRLSAFPPELRAAAERLGSAGVTGYLGPGRAASVREALTRLRTGDGNSTPSCELNRDLFPRDEFNTPSEGGRSSPICGALRVPAASQH